MRFSFLPCLALVAGTLGITACDDPTDPPPPPPPLPPAQVVDDVAVTDEDTAIVIDVLANDSRGLVLAGVSGGAGTAGTVGIVDGQVLYRPETNASGDDTFEYRVRDGSSLLTGTVRVTVRPVNDGPEVTTTDLEIALAEDTSTAISLTGVGHDVDGDALTYVISRAPWNGVISGEAPALTYTPDPDFHGTDSFLFTISDGTVTSAAVLVSLDISSIADAPTAASATLTTAEDVAIAVDLDATDPDGDALIYEVTPPTSGTLSGVAPRLTYTPARDAHGVVAFTYTVSDGHRRSEPATVSIVVEPVADPPTAVGQTIAAVEDTAVAITLADRNGDGAPQQLAVAAGPEHGTLSGTAPNLTYTPARDYTGADRFTFTAAIGEVVSAPATVTITVAGRNDAPVAQAGVVNAVEDTAVTIALAGTDVDGNALTYQVVQAPATGTLTGTGSSQVYTPARDHVGDESLTFTVSDGTLTSAPATVAIRIAAVNDPPVGRDDVAMTAVDTAIDLEPVANDTDPEGDEPALVSATGALHGTVTVDDDVLHYVPAAGFVGTEVLSYTIVDDRGATATAIARIGVGQFPSGLPTEAVASADRCQSHHCQAALSQDGRYLAFVTSAKLVDDDTNGWPDVYVLDRLEGSFVQVSVAIGGAQPSSNSFNPSISADGRRVAFMSFARNLVDGDTNNVADVFVRDLDAGTTVRASVSSTGAEGAAAVVHAAISADGEHVVFTSDAFALVADDFNGTTDAFVRDLATGVTERVSLTSAGGEADRGTDRVAISADGQIVTFVSTATNLVPADTNNVADIFVRDRRAQTTERVSVSSTGVQADGPSMVPALSANGRFVTFIAKATTLVPGGSIASDRVYFHDRTSHNTSIVVMPSNLMYPDWTAISADGRHVTFGTNNWPQAMVVVRDVFAGTTRLVSAPASGTAVNGSSSRPVISGNGRYIVFLSSATNLTATPPAATWSYLIAPNPL